MCKEQESTIVNDDVVGVGVKFQRIRRITGYLVGTVDRFCDSKRKELNDRVLHSGKNFGKVPMKV